MNNEPKKFLLGNLRFVKNGDASIPVSSDNRVILFFGDINGKLETDLAIKLIKRWNKILTDFRSWYRSQLQFKLGKTLDITLQTDTIALCLLVLKDNILDMSALKDALISAGKFAASNKYNIHLNKPDNWTEIETMITEYFVKAGVSVSVYEK